MGSHAVLHNTDASETEAAACLAESGRYSFQRRREPTAAARGRLAARLPQFNAVPDEEVFLAGNKVINMLAGLFLHHQSCDAAPLDVKKKINPVAHKTLIQQNKRKTYLMTLFSELKLCFLKCNGAKREFFSLFQQDSHIIMLMINNQFVAFSPWVLP